MAEHPGREFTYELRRTTPPQIVYRVTDVLTGLWGEDGSLSTAHAMMRGVIHGLSAKRTVIEWLEWAKAQGFEWADAAIENAQKEMTVSLRVGLLSKALAAGFRWRNSPQGIVRWIDIHDTLLEKNL